MDESPGDLLEDFMSQLTNDRANTDRLRMNGASMVAAKPSEASTHFTDRKRANVVDEQWNGHLPHRDASAARVRADIELLRPPIPEYRYMFEKIRYKAECLDDRIEYIADIIDASHGLDHNIANPTRPCQDTVVAVGRICCDALEGKLNDKSVMLESSRAIGMGKRVRLNLDQVDTFSLFPGQIVGVRGTNKTGQFFSVDTCLLPPLPPVNPSPPTISKTTEVVMARGPFTLDDDLSYQPLDALVAMCAAQPPDVLVLMGPFVPSSHSSIAKGTLTALPDDVFHDQVARRLNDLAARCPELTILLLPHADDFIHDYPLFPQPAMSNPALGLDDKIRCLSNPATFSVNGHTIAVGNIDILFQLGREELSKSAASDDRLGRLCRHILQQQTFYPMFPPASGDNIDTERLPDLQIASRPDVLILPSQLKHFAKAVDGVLCVNPGHLSKRQTGGTYARFVFHAGQDNITERTRVDLMKL